jgi:hypothetical protein
MDPQQIAQLLSIGLIAMEPEDGQGDGGGSAGDGQSQQKPPGDSGNRNSRGGDDGGSSSRVLSQDAVNDIVQDRLARERRQYEQRLADLGFEGGFEELEQTVQQRREEEKKRKEEQQKFRELYEQEKTERERLLSEKDQELERVRTTWRQEKVQRALTSAASSAEAVNPDQVTRLLEDRIRLGDDGGAPYPVDQEGNRLTDGNGEYVSVKDFVSGWLEDNLHFARAAGGRGGNSNPGGGGNTTAGGLDLDRLLNDQEYAIEHADELEKVIKQIS